MIHQRYIRRFAAVAALFVFTFSNIIVQAHPLLEIMRGNGQQTRDEAFVGLSADAQLHLLQTLCLIKSNLLEACAQPAVDREKVHG